MMNHRPPIHAPVICLMIWAFTWLAAIAPAQRPLPAGVTMRAEATPDRVVTGDYLTYKLVIEGNVEAQRLTPPDFNTIDGISISAGMSESTRIINRSVTKEWSWTLTAEKVGTITIPPAQVRINGYDYDTEAVQVVVSDLPEDYRGFENVIFARSQSPELNRILRGNFYAAIEAPERIYEGQVVPLTLYIYRDPAKVTVEFREYDIARNLETNDFLVPRGQQTGQRRNPQWETVAVNGRSFQRVPVLTFHVVPTKVGKLRLTPPMLRVYFHVASRAPRQSIDDLFGSMGGMQRVPAELPISSIQIEVSALPDKPQDALAQLVGDNLNATLTVDRATLTRRELLTVRLELLGEGYLETLPAPSLGKLRGLTLIDTKSEQTVVIQDDVLISRKIFEYTYQAVEEGETQLPAMAFAIFDPKTERQRIIETEAKTLTISPASGESVQIAGATPGAAPNDAPARAEARELGRDVAYIDTRPLDPNRRASTVPFYAAPWFFAAQGVPLLASLGFGALAMRRRMKPAETRETRVRRARKQVDAALKGAREMTATGQRDAFYAALSGGALVYTAARLDRSARGITLDEVEAELTAAGANPDATQSLVRLLRHFDAMRYSPGSDDPAAREKALAELTAALEGIDKT